MTLHNQIKHLLFPGGQSIEPGTQIDE